MLGLPSKFRTDRLVCCSAFRSGRSHNSAYWSWLANAWPEMTTVHRCSLSDTLERARNRQCNLVFPFGFDRSPFSRFVWMIQNERSVETTTAPFPDEPVQDGPLLCSPCVSKNDRAMAFCPVCCCLCRHCWLGWVPSTHIVLLNIHSECMAN